MTVSAEIALDAMRQIARFPDGECAEPIPWTVLELIGRAVPYDAVCFDELVPRSRQLVVVQGLEPDRRWVIEPPRTDHPLSRDYWQRRARFAPYAYADRVGRSTDVLLWSDFYSWPALRDTAFYAEDVTAYRGDRHCLMVLFAAPAGHTRRLLLWRRSGSGFTESDRLLLQVLRPCLGEIHREVRRRRTAPAELSPRELEVLRLAAGGLSNAEIAEELVIAVGTVRKHVEHILARLGVRNRSAAAAWYLTDHP